MPLRPILRLLLAGLVAGSALLAPAPLAPGPAAPVPRSLFLVPSALADGPGDWPMFGHDPAHTGYNPDETQLKPPLRLKWSWSYEREVIYSYAPPVVADGVVYVRSRGTLYALDAQTGTEKWSYPTGDSFMSPPAVANGVVYVRATGTILALNATTGALKRSYETGTGGTIDVVDGVVFYRVSDTQLSAIDSETGNVKWTQPYSSGLVGGLVGSPAVARGTMYMLSGDRRVRAFDATTGAPRWTALDAGNGGGGSPTVSSSMVYVSVADLTTYALDAASGAVQWSYPTGSYYPYYPTVAGGTVYVGSTNGRVYALDATMGTLKWNYQTQGYIYTSPAVANGTVYVAVSDSQSWGPGAKFLAFDAATGSLQWSFDRGLYHHTSSPSIARGMVYVDVPGGGYGILYAFEGEPPPVQANVTSAYAATPAFPITWTVPITWTGTAAGSYDVQYRDGPSGAWTDLITGTTALSITSTSSQEGHTYYFRARASSTTGVVGDWSEPVSTTVDLTVPATGPMTINGAALDTTAVTVTLSLSATDSLSGVSKASYSNDGLSWGGWEAFSPTKTWQLDAGDGSKVAYARFRDAAGNVSPVVSDTINLDTSVKGITGVSINEGALYTNKITVTLSLLAPAGTSEMIVSNDGGFAGGQWEPFSAYKGWQITQSGSYVIQRTVYVKYKDMNGNLSATYQDDIILDLNAPSGSVSIEGAGAAGRVEGQGPRVQAPMPHASVGGAERTPGRDSRGFPASAPELESSGYPQERAAATTVTLRLSASDVESGVGGMIVSSSPAFSGASWEPFSATRSWNMESEGKVYVAFKDNAGNASPIYAAALSGAKESLPAVVLGTVHPKTGGTVASAETGTTVAFPPGAVEAKAEVALVPAVESSQQASTGALKGIGKFLTLTAKAGDMSVTTVSQPYTMTVSYTAGDIGGIDESTLGIYWWNGSAWQKEAGSRLDTAARTVSAAINHLSAFAVLGESSTRKLYLPLVIKSAGGW